MEYNPLPEEYINALNSRNEYCLAIMGKDPYPTGAMGIPFCKSNWVEFCGKNVSGLDVFKSLGINIKVVRSQFKSPSEYFIHLAEEKGIIFLNLSYYFLNSACRQRTHSNELQESENINKNYLHKSQNIILCGEAKKIRWYKDSYNNTHIAVHPDKRCKISQDEKTRNGWSEWWSENSLKDKFKIQI